MANRRRGPWTQKCNNGVAVCIRWQGAPQRAFAWSPCVAAAVIPPAPSRELPLRALAAVGVACALALSVPAFPASSFPASSNTLPAVLQQQSGAQLDVVEAAQASRFSTLVAALRAAGTLESLLLTEKKERLVEILTHHVVPGRLVSYEVANIEDAQLARTLRGDRIALQANGREFRYGEAQIEHVDRLCTSGVIHAIDRAVLPKPQVTEDSLCLGMREAASASLLEALRAVPDGCCSSFLAAVEASGADQDRAQVEPGRSWTVFVPTNDAFARLSDAERSALFDPAHRRMLRELFDWHTLPTLQAWRFDFNDRQRGPTMISKNDSRFVLDVLANGMVFVRRLRRTRAPEESFKARSVAGDIQLGDSIVHVVDRVLVPPQLENTRIASQTWLDEDVNGVARGADAQFSATYFVRELLKRAQRLGDEAAMELYQMGLRMLEEVVPVYWGGMLLMSQRDDRDGLRERLRARNDELDRVWHASFLRSSPATGTLSGPLTGVLPARSAPLPSATTQSKVGTASPVSSSAPVVAAAASTTPYVPAELAWCEVLAREVDPNVVRDATLREALAKTGLPWRMKDKASGVEMLLVPPGQFRMGKSPGDDEARSNEVPAHHVALSRSYDLSRCEVTQAQCNAVMGAASEPASARGSSGSRAPVRVEAVDQQGNPVRFEVESEFDASTGVVVVTNTAVDDRPARRAGDGRLDLPSMSSWRLASEFCRRTGLRIPTEAEWEYACRAGVQAGRCGALDEIAWHLGNAFGEPQPVGQKARNALGLHDMLGNTWEWVSDWYSDYTRAAKLDPTGPDSGMRRVIRGSYFNCEEGFCRSSRRYSVPDEDFVSNIGLRVAGTP